jgi:prevent-host-death family protein
VITVNVREAKTQLSRLLRRVTLGEEIVITRSGEPVARLVPIERGRQRQLGIDEGRFEVPDDSTLRCRNRCSSRSRDKDPFDRLLMAQARIESVPILTADPQLALYEVEVLAAVS